MFGLVPRGKNEINMKGGGGGQEEEGGGGGEQQQHDGSIIVHCQQQYLPTVEQQPLESDAPGW